MTDFTETVVLDGSSDFTLLGETFSWSDDNRYLVAFAGDTAGTTTWTFNLEGDWSADGIEFESFGDRFLDITLNDADDGSYRELDILQLGGGLFEVSLIGTNVAFIRSDDNATGTLNLGNNTVEAIRAGQGSDLTVNVGFGGVNAVIVGGGNLDVNGATGDFNYIGNVSLFGGFGDTADIVANDAYIETIVTDRADTYLEYGQHGFGNLTTGGALTVQGGTGYFNSIQNWGGPSEVNLGGGSFNSIVLTGGDSNVFRGGFEVDGEEIYGQLVRMRSDTNRIELQDADINAVELRGEGDNTVIGGSQDIDYVRMDEGNNHLEVNGSRMRFVNMGEAVDQENDGNRVIGGDARIETLRMGASTNHITIGDGDIRDIRVFDTDGFSGSLVIDATGGGRIDALHSSAGTNDITFGTGDIRQINIDYGTAVIDATGGGRLDMLRSFADTLTFTGGTQYTDMMKFGDGNETITLNGGVGFIDLGRGANVVNVDADFLDSLSGHSEGSHDLNVADGAGVGQARLRGDTVMTVNGWVGMARLSDEGDTVNVGETGEMGSLRLNGGADFLNVDGGRIDQVFSYDDADTLNMTGGRINMVNLDGGANEFNVSGGRIDTMRAYDGDDTVTITGGEVSHIEMGSGLNRITIDTGDNGTTLIETHDGRDRITAESYVEFIRTGDNRDVVTVNGGAAMISTGSGADDVLQGGEFIEAIRTGDGRDRVIVGEGGANFIKTGDGIDFIDASASYVQFVWMGNDNDRLQLGSDGVGMARMGSGNDRVFVDQLGTFSGGLVHGGSGEDTLDFLEYGYGVTFSLNLAGQYQALADQDGGTTEDTSAYLGEISIERLFGSRHDDVLIAEDQGDVFGTSNTLLGRTGNDTLISLGTDDFLEGGGGDDLLIGGDGVDVLRGDGGRDTIRGDAGDDRLYGGTSNDTFVFFDDGAGGADRIKDWEDGKDKLDLTDFGFASFDDVLAIASATGTVNTRVDFGDGNQVVIENLLLADFDATDVILS